MAERLLVLSLLLCQCSDDPAKEDLKMEIDVPSPVALGATVTVKVKDQCDSQRSSDCSSQTKLLLDQVRVEDGSVFRVVGADPGKQVTSVELVSLREGTTMFRARGDNGQNVQSFEKEVRSLAPNFVELRAPSGCRTPLRYGTGHVFSVSATRRHGSTLLLGTGGSYPLAATLASPEGTSGTTFKTGDTAGNGLIRSTVNDAIIPIEVFVIGQASSMLLSSTKTKIGTEQFTVDAKVVVGQEPLCGDSFPREVAVETPDVCALVEAKGQVLTMVGKRAGACNVTVKLTGSAIEAKGSFTISG